MDLVIDKDLSDQAEDAIASMKLKDETTHCQHPVPTIIETGTTLENEFRVGQWVGSTSFAETYEVDRVSRANSDTDVAYEARFYKSEALSSSLASYRSRSIRRLSQRTVLRTTYEGLHVIVYRKGALRDRAESADDQLQDNDAQNLLEKAPTPSKASKMSRAKVKTTSQRESNRLRQQSRRKRMRQLRKQPQTSRDEKEPLDRGIGSERESEPDIWSDKLEFFFIQMLHLDRDAAFRREFPVGSRSAVERYLSARATDAALDDEVTLSDYIAIKEREILFLCQQRTKFQLALEKWRPHLDSLLLQQLASPLGCNVDLLKHLEIEQLSRFKDCMVLESGLDALPSLIAEANAEVQAMKFKLLNVRQHKEEREAEKSDKLIRKDPSKEIKDYENWIYHVMPGSATYANLKGDLDSVMEQLKNMDVIDHT